METQIVESEPSPKQLRVSTARAACNAAEAVFAEEWARGGSKAKAYRRAMNYPDGQRVPHSFARAVVYSQKPTVIEYYDALRALASENIVVDIERLLQRDARVVAADDAQAYNELTRYVWLNCRYCWGVKGAYQWTDGDEFQRAMAAWFDACGSTPPDKSAPAQPCDEGGYGFNHWNEPNESCARCNGLGRQQALVADSTQLEGAAAVLYKGIKQTANGIEVLTQDAEKARDRLYKAAGVFKDDAASIARGAAAGAAAGAALGARQADRAAVVAESMTDEQAARMYLELAG